MRDPGERPEIASPGPAGEGLQRVSRVSKRWVVDAFRWHLGAFAAVNAALTFANVLTGPPWWGVWPLLASGLAFGIHYLVYKAVSVDESWAEERVEELNLKSYDRSHIEELKSRLGRRPESNP